MTTPAQPTPKDLSTEFFQAGVNYYAAGRFAVMAGLAPEAGNLIHHALELFMKGQLSRTMTPAQIKKKFWHNLEAVWKAFKAEFPNDNLSGYDDLIKEVNEFEDIRYPDVVAEQGALILFGLHEETKVDVGTDPSAPALPKAYTITLKAVDALVADFFRLVNVNPTAILEGRSKRAKEYLNIGNEQKSLVME